MKGIFVFLACLFVTNMANAAQCWNREGEQGHFTEFTELCFREMAVEKLPNGVTEVYLFNDDVYGRFPVVSSKKEGNYTYYTVEGAYQTLGSLKWCGSDFLRSRFEVTVAVESLDQYETKIDYNKTTMSLGYVYSEDPCKYDLVGGRVKYSR